MSSAGSPLNSWLCNRTYSQDRLIKAAFARPVSAEACQPHTAFYSRRQRP